MDNYGFVESAIENELCQSGVYASVTKGSSMRPLFKTNRDVVILKRCDAEPKKYDVVLYKDGTGKYILHRIVRVSDKCFVIRGDNTFINERVSKNCILAVLTEFNRKGKKHLVTDRGYRLYARIWNFIYPIRPAWHLAYRLAHRVYRALFKRNSEK